MKKNKNIFKTVTIGNLGNKGFTLIEMLITIMIVGFAVAILVGVFGNPLQTSLVESAASQIADQMRSIANGADYYFAKTLSEVTSITDLTSSTYGLLRVVPVPPSSAKANSYNSSLAYEIRTNAAIYNVWGTSTVDTVAILTGVSEAVCAKINEKFAGSNTVPTTLSSTKDLQCFKSDATATWGTVVKVLHVH